MGQKLVHKIEQLNSGNKIKTVNPNKLVHSIDMQLNDFDTLA